MRELSLNILDIAENSIKAEASLIEITIDIRGEEFIIEIKDNGKGMSRELLNKVEDPFTTSRTTRKVGMGIPLFKMSAIDAGGTFEIKSKLGEGTTVIASYKIDNIDRMPLGSIEDTITSLILTKPEINYILTYSSEKEKFIFSTKEVKEMIEEIPIESFDVLEFIKGHIRENIKSINGGLNI